MWNWSWKTSKEKKQARCYRWSLHYILYLKVVGNEKKGGLRFLQWLGTSLGPWRSMSIFILNLPFGIEKCISVSACSSKMNMWFVWQKAMRCKQDLSTYNASIYCAQNVRSVKRDAVRTRKKSANTNIVHNLRCNFAPHRHLLRCSNIMDKYKK